jgi:lysophospholipid acyltransferase (LPLAT)-like uncharacterized protein
MDVQFVKVGKLGGAPVQEFALSDGETVEDLVERAGFETTRGTIKVNGILLAEFNRPLRNGDFISITGDIKAGSN